MWEVTTWQWSTGVIIQFIIHTYVLTYHNKILDLSESVLSSKIYKWWDGYVDILRKKHKIYNVHIIIHNYQLTYHNIYHNVLLSFVLSNSWQDTGLLKFYAKHVPQYFINPACGPQTHSHYVSRKYNARQRDNDYEKGEPAKLIIHHHVEWTSEEDYDRKYDHQCLSRPMSQWIDKSTLLTRKHHLKLKTDRVSMVKLERGSILQSGSAHQTTPRLSSSWNTTRPRRHSLAMFREWHCKFKLAAPCYFIWQCVP